MIKEVYVKNFILIDELHLDFHSHFSCFSGETGAGKSLLIDALSILCGARTSSQYIQKGADKALIEVRVEVEENHPVIPLFIDAGYDLEDNTFTLSREFNLEGKSTTRINQRSTTLSFAKEVMSLLVDIHSQHDNQYLLNNRFHLMLLDAYANETKLLFEVKQAYINFKNTQKELEHLINEEANQDDLDYLLFQLEEIDNLDIKENEVEELETKQKEMASFDKISSKINEAISFIESSRYEQLYNVHKDLSEFENEVLQKANEEITNAYYNIDEQLQNLKDYRASLHYDEDLYNEIQARIFQINKVFRKHGGTYESFIQKKQNMQERVYQIRHRQEYIVELEAKIAEEHKKFQDVALTLSKIRKEKALLLEKEIQKELYDLHLENAKFNISFSEKESASGIDNIEFLISMNAGEHLKPLAKVASGGELSRLMLGLKTIFNRLAQIETIIFDEIDNGVSGSVAYAIGKKMYTIAKQSQVFSVTHLAPVAVWADHHYYVEKTQDENKTNSHIRELDAEGIIRELAIIAQGSTSQQALLAAEELYLKTKTEKSNTK